MERIEKGIQSQSIHIKHVWFELKAAPLYHDSMYGSKLTLVNVESDWHLPKINLKL